MCEKAEAVPHLEIAAPRRQTIGRRCWLRRPSKHHSPVPLRPLRSFLPCSRRQRRPSPAFTACPHPRLHHPALISFQTAVHIIVPPLPSRRRNFYPPSSPSRSPEKPLGSQIPHLGLSSLPAGVAAKTDRLLSSWFLLLPFRTMRPDHSSQQTCFVCLCCY